MSALPLKADMCSATRYVRFVPIADIRTTRTGGLGYQVAGRQPAIVIAMRPEYPYIRFQHPKGSIVARGKRGTLGRHAAGTP